MKMLKMCLNWKVLAGLAAVGVGIYLVAPDLVVAALALLVLAACPISMVLMMWGMHHTQAQGQQTPQEADAGLTREERIERLRTRRAVLADQIGALEQEDVRPAENGKVR